MNARARLSRATGPHVVLVLCGLLVLLGTSGTCNSELVAARTERKTTAPTTQNPATLRWNNGESITGEVVEATETELSWKSAIFAEPMTVKWEALRRIDRALEPVATTEPFSIVLRDGSHLFGDVVAVAADSITIRSARHGEAVLKRSEVLSARRITGERVIAAGPAGESRWRVIADTTRNLAALGTPVPLLKTGSGGALLFPYWNRGAALDVEIPDLAEIEFRVRSGQRPDFQLSLGAGGKHRLRVETWDDELVLTAGRAFHSIRKLGDADREVALRIFWNRAAQKCSVYSPSGEWIADWDVPPDASNANRQILLHNKGRELSLELLRVRMWDGNPPAESSGKLPRVELAGGQTIEGEIGASELDAISVKTEGQANAVSQPLSAVEALVFSSDLPQPAEAEAVLSYADGTLLYGSAVAIREGRASLRTRFSEAPLHAQMDGLRQLLHGSRKRASEMPEPPLAEWDTLVTPKFTLHGKLAGGGDGRLRWLPVGGVRPILPSQTDTIEIRRSFSPTAEFVGAPALFYTHTGDIIPGNLRDLDRTAVEIESSVVEAKTLPVDGLDAIQLGGAGGRNLRGFSDSGWKVVKGPADAVRKDAGSLLLQVGNSVGHPSVLHSNEIKFIFGSESGYGALRVRLFCAGTDPGESTNLLLGCMGNRLSWGIEQVEGQFDNQQQLPMEPGASVTVRMVIADSGVDLYLNGVLARNAAVTPVKRAGAGLVFEAASMWGNPVQPMIVRDFSTMSGPGRAWLPEVSAAAKMEALTVPRFRKDDPPRHALLASNGDLLRGEIEAATATHFGFRSGLENLRVPRDRVRAAIWLKKPDPTAPPPQPPTIASKLLESKLTRRVRYSSAGLGILLNALQREFSALRFVVPELANAPRVTMQLGGQTVSAALDEICRAFGLRYRVQDETIVLEVGPGTASDLVEKVYWLKPSAFASADAAKDALASTGVTLSKPSAVKWNAKSGQLSFTGLATEHEKVAAILATHFGGVLGSQSHWLLLTNGGRLGLAVEKFGDDAVTGSHPIYGRCRIPIAEIHTIRTSPPEPTPAMKSLADWHLLFAPEPVLPESGGESSAALGKPAKPFKLAMLEGGEFELAQWNGKVIVLDFWATWCGPCIKSLPALIESIAAFPADRVTLLGVNQSEPAEQVKRFLETHGWKLPVALDAGQKVARQYGVEGIPHTVIVGPDGNVAWVKTGFSPDGATEAAEAVKKLLSGAAPVPQ